MSNGYRTVRYNGLIITLHWLTVILIAAVYCLMEFKGIYPKDSPGRQAMASWHFTLGLTVLVLTAVRLIARMFVAKPPIVPPIPAWQTFFSVFIHYVLYAMFIILPLLGWALVNAAGYPVSFWGIPLPTLVEANRALAGNIKEAHETIASIGYAVIALHAVAALYHHYFMRDNTLRRMLAW